MKRNLLVAALVLLAVGYFLIIREMRPQPGGEMPAMTGAAGTGSAGMGGMEGMADMPAPPQGLNTERSRSSEMGAFTVAIAPQDPDFARNEIHSWVLTLQDADGRPVEGAEITVGGGMPQHDHGLPTTPQVTKYLGDGRYLVEGLQFHMAGWWELTFDISAAGTQDSITFNLVL